MRRVRGLIIEPFIRASCSSARRRHLRPHVLRAAGGDLRSLLRRAHRKIIVAEEHHHLVRVAQLAREEGELAKRHEHVGWQEGRSPLALAAFFRWAPEEGVRCYLSSSRSFACARPAWGVDVLHLPPARDPTLKEAHRRSRRDGGSLQAAKEMDAADGAAACKTCCKDVLPGQLRH